MSVAAKKKEMRRAVLSAIKAMDPQARKEGSSAICTKLWSLLQEEAAKTTATTTNHDERKGEKNLQHSSLFNRRHSFVASYLPLPYEVDTTELHKKMFIENEKATTGSSPFTLFVPKTDDSAGGRMAMVEVVGGEQDLAASFRPTTVGRTTILELKQEIWQPIRRQLNWCQGGEEGHGEKGIEVVGRMCVAAATTSDGDGDGLPGLVTLPPNIFQRRCSYSSDCCCCRPLLFVVVPATCFGIANGLVVGRLGKGGGYYDRFMAAAKAHSRSLQGGADYLPVKLVGVAFDEQIVPSVPVGEHDVAVDCVVTPTQVLHNISTKH